MPRSTQCRTTSRSARQSARQPGRVEVHVVDVLVALRRILGVLQRPVGAAVEPLRMLGQPRVIGRALDREVERDLEPAALAAATIASKSPERAELGVERVVAAVLRADRPGRADVAGRRVLGVVPALAVRHADRVHRREVDDVEAEVGELRQHLARRRGSRRTSAGRARTTSRSGPARGRRRPRAARTRPRRTGRRRPRRGPPRRSARRGRAERRPRRARSRGRAGRRPACAAARPARSRPGRSTRATVNDQSPGASTVKVPPKRSLPSGTSGSSRRRLARGALTLIAAPSASWPSLKIVAVTSTRSPTIAAGRVAAAVDDRLQSLDLDAGGRLGVLGSGTLREILRHQS